MSVKSGIFEVSGTCGANEQARIFIADARDVAMEHIG